MKISELLESAEIEPHEVRELFMEIAKEIIWLLDNNPSVSTDLTVIDSKIDFLKQWSNSCIAEYTSQNLLSNPDVAFICEIGPSVINTIQKRRNNL